MIKELENIIRPLKIAPLEDRAAYLIHDGEYQILTVSMNDARDYERVKSLIKLRMPKGFRFDYEDEIKDYSSYLFLGQYLIFSIVVLSPIFWIDNLFLLLIYLAIVLAGTFWAMDNTDLIATYMRKIVDGDK